MKDTLGPISVFCGFIIAFVGFAIMGWSLSGHVVERRIIIRYSPELKHPATFSSGAEGVIIQYKDKDRYDSKVKELDEFARNY
jgi:hypothetical protein